MNPESRVFAYLQANKGSLRFANSIDEVVEQVKLFVFYGDSPLTTEQIRSMVARWTITNPILGMVKPTPPPPPPPPAQPTASDSFAEIKNAVQKAVGLATETIKLKRGDTTVIIAVTGITSELKTPSGKVKLDIGWGGKVGIEANAGDIHFTGEISADGWELKLSLPGDTPVPDGSRLGQIFADGKTALGHILDGASRFQNVRDISQVASIIKPNLTKVKNGVEAVDGLRKAPNKRGVSFGFSLNNPDGKVDNLGRPERPGIPPGIEARATLTFWF